MSVSASRLKEKELPSIEEAQTYLVRLPFQNPFRTSFGEARYQESILVRINGANCEGWGEAPVGPYPRYSHETSETAWHILHDFLLPALMEIAPDTIREWIENRPFVRGHAMARGAVISALLDLLAKHENRRLDELYGAERNGALSGISLGIQEDNQTLLSRIQTSLETGYRRIKVKIKPSSDVEILERIRDRFPDIQLMVDGNGGYQSRQMSDLEQLDAFSLRMIEQPFPPPDMLNHARLQSTIETDVCLDESVPDADLLPLVRELDAAQVINIKAPRLGGPLAGLDVYNFCLREGLDVFCGGLLETGIGRAHNVALASLSAFDIPGDISASSRYFSEDVVSPPFEITESGIIKLPEGRSGIAVEPRRDFIRNQSERTESFRI